MPLSLPLSPPNPARIGLFLALLLALPTFLACSPPSEEPAAGKQLSGAGSPLKSSTEPLYTLPQYELTSHNNVPFGSKHLSGQVYVVNFFFTRCQTMCPPLMKAAQQLRAELDKAGLTDVQSVSFSVDPDKDTPQVMTAYAKKLGLELGTNWNLLTGPWDKITTLITGSFKMHVGEASTDEQGLMDIAHTGHFIVVDRLGRIRKFISTDEHLTRAGAIPEVMEAVKKVHGK